MKRRIVIAALFTSLISCLLSAETIKTSDDFDFSAILEKPQATYAIVFENLYGVSTPSSISDYEEIVIDPSGFQWNDKGDDFTDLFRITYTGNLNGGVDLRITPSAFISRADEELTITPRVRYLVNQNGVTTETGIRNVNTATQETISLEGSGDSVTFGIVFAENNQITNFASSYVMTIDVIVEGK